jgi:hypothetical protein
MLIGFVFVVFGSLIGVGSVSAETSLTEEEEAMFSQNNILFYEPCVTVDSSRPLGGDISIAGSTAEEKVWSGLASFLSDAQAAGIMGNIAQEDGNYNPLRREVGQGGKLYNRATQMGLGLVQWSFGRRVNLLNYVKERDSSLLKHFENDSLAQVTGDELIKKLGDDTVNKLYQLEIEFLKSEIDKSYKGYYKQTDPEDAAVWFEEHFERAGVPNNDYRMEKAREAFEKYAGKTISGSSGENGEGVACNASFKDSKNINGAAVALAWPFGTDKEKWDYRQSNGLSGSDAYENISKWTGGKATDAFNAAIDAVYKDRSWSQCPKIGASCDVFVGTVVRYSGYDKGWPRGLGQQDDRAREKSDLWETIHNVSGLDPQPGDVVNTGTHTYIVVQDEKGDFYRAEASLCDFFGRITRKFKGFESGATVFRAKSANNSTAGVSVQNGVSTSSTTGVIAGNTTKGNHDIGATAFYFAWTASDFENRIKPESKDAWYEMVKEETGSYPASHVTEGASCVVFVSGVLRYAGMIDKFIVDEHLDERLDRDPNWTKVADGNLSKDVLQDGDVLIRRCSRNGSSHYPCHYGIYAEKDGQGYTVQASNVSGCNSDSGCKYSYPKATKGLSGGFTEAWRNPNNKTGGGLCNVCVGEGEDGGSGGSAVLKDGGLDLASAKKIMNEYKQLWNDNSKARKYYLNYPCENNGVLIDNCTSFSRWFVNAHASKKMWDTSATGHGKDVASNIAKFYGLSTSKTPSVYSVFSGAGSGYEGHTGVIFGIDTKRKKAIIGEAGYCQGKGFIDAKEVDLTPYTSGAYTFVNVNSVINISGT